MIMEMLVLNKEPDESSREEVLSMPALHVDDKPESKRISGDVLSKSEFVFRPVIIRIHRLMPGVNICHTGQFKIVSERSASRVHLCSAK